MSQAHLLRRGSVWHYRRRVPLALVSTFGKKEIQFSLGTGDLKEAKKRRAAEDLKWAMQFEAVEKTLACAANDQNGSIPNASPLSERDVIRLVQDYVDQMDKRAEARLMSDPPENAEQKVEIAQDIEYGLDILQNPDDIRSSELVYAASKVILHGSEPPTSDPSLPYAVFAEWVRRGLLELDRRHLARVVDDHSRAFFDQAFDPHRRAHTTFGELADQFIRMTEEEAATNKTSQKSVDKQRASVGLLREIIGDTTPIQDVNYDACLRVRSVLARFPANRTKIYPGLSVDDAIVRAESDGKPTLSFLTQEGYLGTLKALLDLAARKQLIVGNPAHGMKPLKRATVAASDRRRPFSPEQLKQFFGGTFYRTCAQQQPPYAHDKEGWRFWLPLMCLFMGMRPNEACQMNAGDVKQSGKGTWYVDVVASSDEDDADLGAGAKTLKTSTSRRRIPVHPELIAIGFLDFAAQRRAAGHGAKLFPHLKPDGYGNYASYPLKRFREAFLPKAITVETRQSFYSFRHNFRDALRAIDAPPDALQALGGWSQGNLVSDAYGDKASPDYQMKFVKEISFEELDLSDLHVTSGA